MGIGKFVLNSIGMKQKFQPFFEKLIKLGAMGLGYEEPMKSNRLEKKLLSDVIKSNGKKKFVLFDVGANKGDYTKMGLDLNDSIEIHCFEPDPNNFQVVQERFASTQNVVVNNLGLSNRKGELDFYVHDQDYLSTFNYSQNTPGNYRSNKVKKVIKSKVLPVDSYCLNTSIKFIDFLKIDTEGHDLFVLEGAENLLKSKSINHIQFEFSEMNLVSKTSFFDFWKLLQENYTVYRMCKDANYEITNYQPLVNEIYYPVNFYAKAKN